MFPKNHRVTVIDFRRNPSHSNGASSFHISIRVKQTDIGATRFCISMPKKAEKRSSHRHTCRRYLVEWIRPLLSDIQKKRDIWIVIHKSFDKGQKEIILSEIHGLFQKVQV